MIKTLFEKIIERCSCELTNSIHFSTNFITYWFVNIFRRFKNHDWVSDSEAWYKIHRSKNLPAEILSLDVRSKQCFFCVKKLQKYLYNLCRLLMKKLHISSYTTLPPENHSHQVTISAINSSIKPEQRKQLHDQQESKFHTSHIYCK